METENSSEKKKNSFTKEYHDPNPWEVSDVTAFLYYCCPECDDRIAFEDAFIQHAILHHERVSTAGTLFKIVLFSNAPNFLVKNTFR